MDQIRAVQQRINTSQVELHQAALLRAEGKCPRGGPNTLNVVLVFHEIETMQNKPIG